MVDDFTYSQLWWDWYLFISNFTNIWFEGSGAYHFRGMERYYPGWNPRHVISPEEVVEELEHTWEKSGSVGVVSSTLVFIAMLHISFCLLSKAFLCAGNNIEKLHPNVETVFHIFLLTILCFSLGHEHLGFFPNGVQDKFLQTVPGWSGTACSVHSNHTVSHFVPTHMAFVPAF